jgi:sucrose-6-phosphate hydrolase SacC (GH32 family)
LNLVYKSTLFCVISAILASCSDYSDFTLPAPSNEGIHSPFQWFADPKPVLSGGVDTLNPSVVKFRDQYWNFYSEYDGKTWHTAVAVSGDGVHWEKQGRVISPSGWEGNYIAANGSAVVDDGKIFYWYQAGDPPRIALAVSMDGMHWEKRGAVVSTGPWGSFDEFGVSDPSVNRAGDFLYLFYTGLDRARRQRLGLARSRDGIRWEKLRANPILEMGADENGLGEPAVWSGAGFWWMLFTVRAADEQRRIGLAKSRDGVHWSREPLLIQGEQDWDREVVCDPTVEVMPNEIRVWFGGGDRRSPDQNLHGQIGVGHLRNR